MNPLEQFIDQIITEQKLDDMPADFLAEYKMRLIEEAQKRMGVVAVSKLSPEQIEELNKKVEETNNDPETIKNYLESHIANFDKIMSEALLEFKQEVLRN